MAVAILMLACSQQTPPQQNAVAKQETPKVLTGESSDIKMSYKRWEYGSDLFDELYDELSEKDPDLKAINERLEKHYQTLKDSLEAFDVYTDKSVDYYHQAVAKLENISDSTLKINMEALLRSSERLFENRIAALQKLTQAISDNNISLKDRYMVLKVVTTLKSIEKFQKETLPDNRELKNVIKEQDKLLAEMQNCLLYTSATYHY